jgi:hypothetical protein
MEGMSMTDMEKKAVQDLPFFREKCEQLHDIAINIGQSVKSCGRDDRLALMGLCFLNKQIEHMESALMLVKAGQYRDASLIVRSMIEGLAQILHLRPDPQGLAKRYVDFASVTSWRKMNMRIKAGQPPDPETQEQIAAGIKSVGPQFYTAKAKECLAANKLLPADPYWKNWTGKNYSQLLRDANGGELVDFVYGAFSEWHHWSPEGFETSLRWENANHMNFLPPPINLGAKTLRCAFQCLFQQASFVDGYFHSGFDARLAAIREDYLTNRPSGTKSSAG